MSGEGTGAFGCTRLLAQLMAGVHQDVAADDFEALEHGVACTIILESGDRYRVSLEWVGDDE